MIRIIREGWCQQTYAADDRGGCVDYDSPDAQRWCMLGALRLSTFDAHSAAQSIAEKFLNYCRCPMEIFNDFPGRTKEEVITKLEEFAKC